MRMRMAVLTLCSLLGGCSFVFDAEDVMNPKVVDASSEAQDALIASVFDASFEELDSDLPLGGTVGNCTLGTGAATTLSVTVSPGWLPVMVCGPSGSSCEGGITPPCICPSGTQCDIAFRVGSEVQLSTDDCSRWLFGGSADIAEIFTIVIDDLDPLVVVQPRFCE